MSQYADIDPQDIDLDYPIDDDDACQQCGGDGGYNSCLEDTCPTIGGEEGCEDPLCWRVCTACKGRG